MLEDIYTRRRGAPGYDRRISDGARAKAKADLDRCREIAERNQTAA